MTLGQGPEIPIAREMSLTEVFLSFFPPSALLMGVKTDQ